MLRACRRILRPGGRLAFLTIQPTPGLGRARRRRANRAGPPGVAVRTSYPSLLTTAGFVDIEARDVTAEYRATQRAWMDTMDSRADALRVIMGDAAFDERVTARTETLRAIDVGLLSRFLYHARIP